MASSGSVSSPDISLGGVEESADIDSPEAFDKPPQQPFLSLPFACIDPALLSEAERAVFAQASHSTPPQPVDPFGPLPVHDPVFATGPLNVTIHEAQPFHIPLYSHVPEWIDPSTWPSWFRDVRQCLDKLDLPQCYIDLLSVLAQFEGKHGFAQSKALVTSLNHPQEVGLWIKNARKRASLVSAERVQGLKSDFWRWWKSVQPSWCEIGDGDQPLSIMHHRCTGDWSMLDVCGSNGVVAFVACLGFWGTADQGEEWQLAVADVLWVLRCIMEAMDRS